jgi:hypothetical protein
MPSTTKIRSALFPIFFFFHVHVHASRRSFASYFFLSTCLLLPPFFPSLSLVYSTWAQVSLGHCNLHHGAGTSFLLLYISFTTMPVLRFIRHATLPSLLSSYPLFLSVSFPPPHTCTSTNRLLSPAPAIPIVLSVCILACVFPILSRAVVLLYMGLSQAIAARVSHHLYDFAMLS